MGYTGAHSTEIDSNPPYPVVSMMDDQMEIVNMGGTMRLGGHDISIISDTKLYNAYGASNIRERFRHRYHINGKYCDQAAQDKGLIISAYDTTGKIINAIELTGDHWMVGVQFHPEYTSRPDHPSPIYKSFIKAIIKKKYDIAKN